MQNSPQQRNKLIFDKILAQLQSAKDTVTSLREYIKQAKLKKTDKLEHYIEYIKKLGRQLQNDSLSFIVPNVLRRILSVIRFLSNQEGNQVGKSHHEKRFKEIKDAINSGEYKQITFPSPKLEDDVNQERVPNPPRKSVRQDSRTEDQILYNKNMMNNFILPAFDVVLDELNQCQEEINGYVQQLFFSNEVILIYQFSSTMKDFLLKSNQIKNLEIIVVQDENSNAGESMAKELSKSDLKVTLIPFSNAFAIMQRVNKVLFGVDAIFKNGGLLMHPGTYMISLAAKQFSVPVIALSGAHKLTAKYSFGQNTFNELLSPLEITDEINGKTIQLGIRFDYVPPEYITLYITNLGQFTPQSIYQLFNDFYDAEFEDI